MLICLVIAENPGVECIIAKESSKKMHAIWGKPAGIRRQGALQLSVAADVKFSARVEEGIPGWCYSSASRGRWFILEVPPFGAL